MEQDRDIFDFFLSDKNKVESKKILNEFLSAGIDFKTRDRVINYLGQKELQCMIDEELPLKPSKIEDLLIFIKKTIIEHSINFSSKNFIAFPDSGNSLASLAGHILFGFLNQNLINSKHTSPIATFVEAVVIKWLRTLIGYPVKEIENIFDIGGINVNGGVSANTIAMLLAREKKFPETMIKGIFFDTDKVKIIIPKSLDHYSISASLGWLGLGTKNIIEVNIDSNFKIDRKHLNQILSDTNIKPIALVAYAGDSRTMSIDDFEELSEIAQRHKIWFHIDACHGFSLGFSNKLRNKIKGINLADSITFDPHKVLYTPYTSSYLLVRKPEDFKLVSGVSDLITKENFSFGQITPFFGSRAFDSLKLWMTIKNIGKDKIGEFIEKRHHLANFLADKISILDDFYILNDITINSVVFIYIPNKLKTSKKIAEINNLNLEIHSSIFEQGDFYIHTFLFPDIKNTLQTFQNNEKLQVLRCMIGNPLTDENSLCEFVEYIKNKALEIFNRIEL